MEPPTEVPKTSEDEKKVRKEIVLTEVRQENLRKAREKAVRLRQELKEKKEKKTEVINKDEPTTRPTDDKPVDQPITERTEQDVQQVEKPQPQNTTRKDKEKPIPDKSIEPIHKQEEPKIEPKIEPPKPKIYRREGGFLYM